ncbi:HK97 family phage prohead protease [Paraburkholderia adhaesiva]|uniref:HK97 family phage prohead protease n=1 Tax=Paraburkholderia adhaesiva TaxID=2883244 RepID=UPI001F1BB38E|nr:HK97 family phage prohead protease [Paraburkholderia adhaesiva]
MNRDFWALEVRSVDEDVRVLEGVATTPVPDRYEDIVEPMGALYKLPLPLLWQHNHHEPVGHVEFAQPDDKGIPFRARVARLDEPGRLKDRLDEAWQSVKANLVRAVSIGFLPLEESRLEHGGVRFIKWEWIELSLVTIPANPEATIHTIRSMHRTTRAASGTEGGVVVRLDQNPARAGAKPFVIHKVHVKE